MPVYALWHGEKTRLSHDPTSDSKRDTTGQCTAKGKNQSSHAALVTTCDRRRWQSDGQPNQATNGSPADE
jgi:hypothetical protein